MQPAAIGLLDQAILRVRAANAAVAIRVKFRDPPFLV